MNTLLSKFKKKLKFYISLIFQKNYVVSLGSGCDLKLFLINKFYNYYPTEFFDYLWNFDAGLGYVKEIIMNDFEGFSKKSDYIFTYHKKFQPDLIDKLSENELNIQNKILGEMHFVPIKYPEISFMHYKKLDYLVKTYKKKVKRFKKILKRKNLYFVYYRQFDEPIMSEYVNNSQYDLDKKINYWINESLDFLNFVINLNKSIKILSLFALPFDFDKSLIDKYKINEKSKSNLKFDFLYYKNADVSDRSYVDAEMERIFKKYLFQSSKIKFLVPTD